MSVRGQISFAGDGLAAELLPVEELADCAATALARDGSRILSYGTGAGYTPLRELLGGWLGVHPYRVVVTNGWLQGFALLADVRARGRNVILETPTFAKVAPLLFAAGAGLVTVDRNEGGFSFEQLEHVLRTTQDIAFLYTTPSFHNPTGLRLSTDERIRLAAILTERGDPVLALEDDTYGFLRFEDEVVPTLFSLSGEVGIYSASFSYSIAPGLRVGVFVLPQAIAGEVTARANATFISPALLSQATVFEFIQRGALEPHLERVRTNLRERRDAMLSAIDARIENAVATRPSGGIFLQLRLAPGVDAGEVLDRADGVTADAGTGLGAAANTLRLNFGSPGLDEIEPGIERLAAALR